MTIHKYMSNKELADIVQNPLVDASFYEEAANRLRATPEPKADFYVGWKGKTVGGLDAEIYGTHDDIWVGRIDRVGSHWYIGHEVGDDLNCLIPNTPPEPEKLWRYGDVLFTDEEKTQTEKTDKAMEALGENRPKRNFQRVEVRVFK